MSRWRMAWLHSRCGGRLGFESIKNDDPYTPTHLNDFICPACGGELHAEDVERGVRRWRWLPVPHWEVRRLEDTDE